MTKKQRYELWFANEANRMLLKDVLSNRSFRAACETLLFNSQPDATTVFSNADAVDRHYAWLGGYNQFLRDLHQLADVPMAPPSFEGNEWNY